MNELAEENTTLRTQTINSFKNCIKAALMAKQSAGSSTEWLPENFRLCTQIAVRKSSRIAAQTDQKVSSTELNRSSQVHIND